jgi:hypothetical protein
VVFLPYLLHTPLVSLSPTLQTFASRNRMLLFAFLHYSSLARFILYRTGLFDEGGPPSKLRSVYQYPTIRRYACGTSDPGAVDQVHPHKVPTLADSHRPSFFFNVGKSSWTPCRSLKSHSGHPDARQECPGTSFELLSGHSFVFSRSKGAVPLLNLHAKRDHRNNLLGFPKLWPR